MMQWNHRLFPYPLLARWNDDYGDRVFQANIEGTLSNGRKINLGIEFENGSEYLKGLVFEKKAQYVLVASCSATAAREVITSPLETTLYELDAGDYTKELVSVPYIVSMVKLNEFTCVEHAVEIREAVPEGFTIAPGCILAAGVAIRTPLEGESNAASVIDLIGDERVREGTLVVELDQERIQIVMSRQDKARVEKLRTKPEVGREQSLLYSSLYLPTVTEAVRGLSEHSDRRWAVVLRNALEKCEIDPDDDLLQNNALKHAQEILKFPIGRSLIAFTGSDEVEE